MPIRGEGAPKKPVERRHTGFHMPFHKMQVVTWILFVLIVAHYYWFLLALLWEHIAVQVIVTAVVSLSVILSAYGAYMSCSIDPVDDAGNAVITHCSSCLAISESKTNSFFLPNSL